MYRREVSQGWGWTRGVLITGLHHTKDHLWEVVFIVIKVFALWITGRGVRPTRVGHRDEHGDLHAIMMRQCALHRGVLAGRGRCSGRHVVRRRQRTRTPRKRVVPEASVERRGTGGLEKHRLRARRSRLAVFLGRLACIRQGRYRLGV